MIRDTYDMFEPPERGRFGGNERREEVEKVRLTDVTLVLRQERTASIMVTQTDAAHEKWISLPKSWIEFRRLSATTVEVTLPEKIAREKGLI